MPVRPNERNVILQPLSLQSGPLICKDITTYIGQEHMAILSGGQPILYSQGASAQAVHGRTLYNVTTA
jgi:hypothetical protein